MADDARDLFNIEIDEFQKKAKVMCHLYSETHLAWALITPPSQTVNDCRSHQSGGKLDLKQRRPTNFCCDCSLL